ncbi:rhamnan synthesis F family protein [Burkholderia cepacia]|uniref:rhamnan synthesis F family protein n=1 Tax=Burkholderia cepacia TaxID=292 RepID=UPI003A4DCBDB
MSGAGDEGHLVSIDHLMEARDELFVSLAFKLLFKRAVDAAGLEYYSGRLRKGHSRISILDQLIRSAEARPDWESVPGLSVAVARFRKSRRLGGWRLALFDSELGVTPVHRKARARANHASRQQGAQPDFVNSTSRGSEEKEGLAGWLGVAEEEIRSERNKAEGVFDPDWYCMTYPDVQEGGVEPLLHYVVNGSRENRNPGPKFDTNFYLSTYPDVSGTGLNPLVHYIKLGRQEGRATNARQLYGGLVADARSVIVKEMCLAPRGEAALLVSHAPAGRLKPHVLPYIQQLQGAGLKVQLVVVVYRPLELRDEEIAAADGVIVRDNVGFDFGAWAHAFQLCPSLFGASLLVMANDSVVPTSDSAIFLEMMDRVRACPSDIVGLTASHEHGWHVQSHFMGVRPRALSSWAFQHFIRDIRRVDNENDAIRAYERPFTTQMRKAGLTVSALFTGSSAVNPTFFSWRELIDQGFPFIKIEILLKRFSEATDHPEVLQEIHAHWPQVLAGAGFDVNLVRASLRAADMVCGPAGSDDALLINASEYEAISNDHPLRVAYFGPWNYENGLGAASREMLCTLRLTDIQLNAYPVTKPFHVHRLICPAVETLDFVGNPDIAVVHLNPDSWDVLTDEQLEIIQSAKHRIGYWVWETDRIPPAWQKELYSVDRIWAPSQYCADIFSAEVKVPVDVIHHPVRVPTRIASSRDSILRRFGIDPANRVILYIFDAASYLIRKNPEGLIRAFAASGLAKRGWNLVLKTKHLYDRPDAGNALYALATNTPGVKLLEVSLHADEVTSLMNAADIYASPHCSEGFGLTVAEAMALGKPVVVTDFGGTRDFVNSDCGYPVQATPWVLEEDHGHYLAGHGWGKVDENALAAALVKAATAIAKGDRTMNEAARNNIARLLSYDAVARAVEASFAAAIAASAANAASPSSHPVVDIPPAPPAIAVDLASARRFTDFAPGRGLVPVSLADDLSWTGVPLVDGDPDDWLIFAPGGARISPDAEQAFLSAAISRPDVVLFYADDVAGGEDPLDRVRLKPDFNPTLLVAQDYVGVPVSIRRKTLTAIGGLNVQRGTAVLYDVVLRVAEAGGAISRIPKVLLGFEGRRPAVENASRLAALTSLEGFSDIALSSEPASNLLFQRRRFADIGHPSATIVIPTCRTARAGADGSYIEQLLEGISEVRWPMDRLTVIVGDDIAGRPDWMSRKWPFRLKRIETVRDAGEPFNYAAKMNQLWRAATDEQIVFMNDDVVPVGADWLAALLTFAVDERVGGVGARLYFENGHIQHAGMFPTLRTIAHAWLGWPAEAKTYQNWAVAQREWSVVTGAVFATRRSILSQVNGFDERFGLEFNDVDLCLRIRNLGYRIVYNPDAQFVHAEKASRGETIPNGAEVALFLTRWARWLNNDPASHPGLAQNRMDLVADPVSRSWYF